LSAPQKSKELKVFSKQVITADQIKRDVRKLKLLMIINILEEISEKALTHLIYLIQKEKGIDLGYKFFSVAGNPSSKQLLDDIFALLYVGLIETNPRNKKLRLTSTGKEFLEQITEISEEEFSPIRSAIEELRSKIQLVDAEVELLGLRSRRRF